MKQRYFSVILILFMLFTVSYNVFACVCWTPLACGAYSRAESVFIGKLEKVEQDKTKGNYTFNAYFSVEKTFKGKTLKVENMSFLIADCERELKVGEKYLVYKEDAKTDTPCNRTGLLSWAVKDLEYINNLSETHPVFNISGYITNLDETESKNAEISVTNGRYKPQVLIDKNGLFNFTVKRKGTYHIKITLPFTVEESDFNIVNDIGRSAYPNKISYTKSLHTIVEYNLKFKPNDCDYRQIKIYEKR